ncbi:M16 family metallopeptidase [Clostridium ganghwense]|uniref:Pitrilysin family protein n=1 Tax=Clostridium ganghwense TaxID=312089 RepID=A0ABT4CNK3_9CLOT|nr:pitrilysin family protein [Clostridium ganghwense]MCY6370639.1 pitrilysin family protein [Clostridium ganghwense]
MEKGIFDLQKHNLDNGLTVVTIKKDTQLASVHVGIKIGSIYEKVEQKGISHFVEHMMFKGTKKRTNEELNEELEQRAGDYNAYTDYNCTVYSMTVLKEEIEASIELMADMTQNSNFPEEEIERERGVILAEIRTSKDDIEDYSFKNTMECAFKKSSIRIDTIGSKNTVEKFKRNELMEFYKRYYVPNNAYITLVSSYDHDEAINLIEKYFKDWQKKEFEREKVIVENNIPIKKISYKKDAEQCTIVYLYTFHNLSRDEELALRIMNYKFGESANSVLFRRLREERGLAYDVCSELDMGKYVKTLSIYTAVNEDDVSESLDIINKSIEDIQNEKIVLDDKNISLMKKVLKTAVVSTLEDSTQLSNYVVHQIIDKEDIYEFIDNMNNMENIKGEDIYKVSKKVLKEPTIHILLSEKSDE